MNDQQVFKKEIFVIKHQINHELKRHDDEDDPNALNPSSSGSQNPNRRRRYSRSKRSFDSDLDTSLKNDDGDDKTENDEALHNHHHRHREEVRVSSPSRMRRHRSCSKERRISISPSRRSESPFRSLNTRATDVGSSNRPAKMVSVPATNKSNNGGAEQPNTSTVKRIHVKRNVSPARTHLRLSPTTQAESKSTEGRLILCVIEGNR
ncbi:unnamed protein product [Lactuca virosa]|uniref:Uncharacterized protein n=1 Tax=Lactuca virosa TaxID=75947 RepID=A0AAU9MD07_9ASTR|nr:unnamed protein product [Lactuca virosa]